MLWDTDFGQSVGLVNGKQFVERFVLICQVGDFESTFSVLFYQVFRHFFVEIRLLFQLFLVVLQILFSIHVFSGQIKRTQQFEFLSFAITLPSLYPLAIQILPNLIHSLLGHDPISCPFASHQRKHSTLSFLNDMCPRNLLAIFTTIPVVITVHDQGPQPCEFGLHVTDID